MSCRTLNTISLVEAIWRISLLTWQVTSASAGSNSVSIHGPSGQKVSKPLARVHCPSRRWGRCWPTFATCGRSFRSREAEQIEAGVLKAYRWQYIVSGVQDPRFQAILGEMITPAQSARIGSALAPILG